MYVCILSVVLLEILWRVCQGFYGKVQWVALNYNYSSPSGMWLIDIFNYLVDGVVSNMCLEIKQRGCPRWNLYIIWWANWTHVWGWISARIELGIFREVDGLDTQMALRCSDVIFYHFCCFAILIKLFLLQCNMQILMLVSIFLYAIWIHVNDAETVL